MADRRKLQGEIERCLKKVAEGVETFEDIWQKICVSLSQVHSATNANQKEKYEADLKKEIKKLQRLRDQIKTWLTSSDIKDKRSLQDARKLIETQMERFKVVERETKTKAYSKEGLGAAQKLDPAQRERDEITSWLTVCIERLTIQVDMFESDMDSINLSLKKKKNDKEKLDRFDELKVWQGKHKYHINQLEALLRMLDNGTVEVDQIKKIKDDVEYYRDFSQEPDFEENEFIYDDLNLEDMEDYLAKQQAAHQQTQLELKNASADEENSTILSNTPTSTSSNSPSHSPCLGNHSSTQESTASAKPVKTQDSSSTINIVQRPPSPSNMNSSILTENSSTSFSHVNFHNSQAVIPSQQSSTPYAAAAAGTTNNHFKMSNSHENMWPTSNCIDDETASDVNTKSFHCSNSTTNTLHNNTSHLQKPSSVSVTNSWTDSDYRYHVKDDCPSGMQCDSDDQDVLSCVADNQQLPVPESKKSVTSSVNCQSESRATFGSSATLNGSSNSMGGDNNFTNYGDPWTETMRVTPKKISDDSQSTLKNLAQQVVLNNQIHNLQFSALQSKGSQMTHNILGINSSDHMFQEITSSAVALPNLSPPTNCAEISISQIFGELPQNPYSTDHAHYLRILDAACKHLPMSMDSQKHRPHGPANPSPTPDYYPSHLSNSNTMEFFQRLSTETLFFIFYFLQGTKAQYLAARALKTKSWRFHTMFMMWFQRHEEPKTITDEYEQGTYIYFDFEKWAQRKKEGFTFEYKYLEDRDLN